MTTWQGWEAELLSTLEIKFTPENGDFLDQWVKADGTSCKDNPLAASLPFGGSTDCHTLSGGQRVQAYTTHGHGIAATAKQLQDPRFAPILAALKSETPNTYTDWQLVVGSLGSWGAHAFAVKYGTEAQKAQTGGPSSGPADAAAPRGLAGYKHFSHQLSHTIPEQLRRSQHLRRQALAKIRAKT